MLRILEHKTFRGTVAKALLISMAATRDLRAGLPWPMIKTFESGLGEGREQSGGGVEGSKPVLGWAERDVRVDTVENEPLQYLRRSAEKRDRPVRGWQSGRFSRFQDRNYGSELP